MLEGSTSKLGGNFQMPLFVTEQKLKQVVKTRHVNTGGILNVDIMRQSRKFLSVADQMSLSDILSGIMFLSSISNAFVFYSFQSGKLSFDRFPYIKI